MSSFRCEYCGRDICDSVCGYITGCLHYPIKVKEMKKAHPGFKAVQNKIAKERGVSKERAGAMLAASTRKASAGAKKANPRLKKVKG